MPEVLIIHNPRAGVKKKINLKNSLQEWNEGKIEYDYIETEYSGHATAIAQNAIEKGYKKIFAAGGDGTVNEIASALVKTNITLAILPMGSGNGLARHNNIPLDLKQAFLTGLYGDVRKIDCGTINGKKFFCAAGIGFDAHVSEKFAQSKTRGLSSYIHIATKEYLRYKSKNYKINIDNIIQLTRKAFFITFANANQFGNHAYVAPQANISDGQIDICILKPFAWFKGFKLAYQLFNKKIQSSKLYTSFKGEKIIISSEMSIPFHYDGESIKNDSNQIEVTVIPESLRLVIG